MALKRCRFKSAIYLMTIRAILLNGAFKEGINFLSVQVNDFVPAIPAASGIAQLRGYEKLIEKGIASIS